MDKFEYFFSNSIIGQGIYHIPRVSLLLRCWLDEPPVDVVEVRELSPHTGQHWPCV